MERGKFADIIAMPGDPTADITATERVLFVIKQGKIIRKGPLTVHASAKETEPADVEVPVD